MFFQKDFDKKNLLYMFWFMEDDICNWIPEQISIVHVNGIEIPVDEVEVLNIEEDYQGRDILIFNYKGEKKTSPVTTKYI
jgi:hypothetical protein